MRNEVAPGGPPAQEDTGGPPGAGLAWEIAGAGKAVVRAGDGRALADYSYAPEKNHPFFSNVRSATSGAVVTNHAPHDHRWHHGLWWSWKFINDVLYWEDHPDYGGNRIGLGHSQVDEHAVASLKDGRLRVSETLSWRENNTATTVLTEHRTMILSPSAPGMDTAWSIDWDMEWTAEIDAVFDTTPYPEISWGGYAGLNYRPARSLASRESLIANGGREDEAAIHGASASWMAYSGDLDGAENDEPANPAVGGLALFEHPENEGFPHWAYAQTAANGFGFLASAPLMSSGLSLSPGQRLRLRYRTIILGAAADACELDAAYHRYHDEELTK
jgi:hypothetical protein